MQLNCTSNVLDICVSSCSCFPILNNETTTTTIDYSKNVGVAFALVAGAGLSTTIGAALVFCNRFVTQSNQKVLGASLGFSSGVMIYVSFVEILQKSLKEFESCNCLWITQSSNNAAYTATTICFFGGVLIVFLLGYVIHIFHHLGHGHSHGPEILKRPSNEKCNQNHCHDDDNQITRKMTKQDDEFALEDQSSIGYHTHIVDHDGEMMNQTLTRDLGHDQNHQGRSSYPNVETNPDKFLNQALSRNHHEEFVEDDDNNNEEVVEGDAAQRAAASEKHKLNQMGIMTAVAIGLHNFPEGLATFVSALADPVVGVGLAIAIAIHNIPEGLCVSIPIYYATGSRWRGFWMAFFSGITELIGAAFGYGFLMAVMGPAAYAVLFGLVAGMMVAIVVKELLPTAHRYDPTDRVVTLSLFAGMAILALSLLLFRLN